MTTTVITKPGVSTTAQLGPPDLEATWQVILFNDEIHPFDLVVLAVQKAAGLSLEVAQMITLEAHEAGHAIVKRGLTQEDAVVMVGRILKYTKADGIFPGVNAEAEKE